MPREAEIALYDVIDPYFGISAKGFRDELKGLGEVQTIHVRVNSPGDAVFDGLAIYNMLRSHAAKKIVHMDGMALSMASLVAMARRCCARGSSASSRPTWARFR